MQLQGQHILKDSLSMHISNWPRSRTTSILWMVSPSLLSSSLSLACSSISLLLSPFPLFRSCFLLMISNWATLCSCWHRFTCDKNARRQGDSNCSISPYRASYHHSISAMHPEHSFSRNTNIEQIRVHGGCESLGEYEKACVYMSVCVCQ